MWRIRSVIALWASVAAVTRLLARRRLGQRDVEADVGLAVGGEVVERGVHRRDLPVERVDAPAVGALGGQQRDAELDGQARVERVPPARELLDASAPRAGGGGSATNVPPPRPRAARRWPLWTSAVSAWRSVEREISSRAHSSRSAGSCVPGASRPSLIAVPRRSSASSNAVWDRTGANTLSLGAAWRRASQPLESAEALPVRDRRVERRELDVARC